MFTGIVTHTSAIKATKKTAEGMVIKLARPKTWTDLAAGESIATDGVCLTVTAVRDNEYECLAVPETLAKTSFKDHLPKVVNLERSMTIKERFSGHFVQGHVDGVGVVTAIDKASGWRLTIQFAAQHRELVVYKGSITVNGVALTVASVDGNQLQVALIPFTLEHTTLGGLKVGSRVNLEFDEIAKYVINALKVRKYNAAS